MLDNMGIIDIKTTTLAGIVIGIIAVLFIVGEGINSIANWLGFGEGGGTTYVIVAWVLVIIFVCIAIYKIFID